MLLRSLYLHQFRRYGASSFEFDAGLNLFCGSNAQGKTSLLEAIYCLILGRSFRCASHRPLFQMGAPSFYLEAIFSKEGVDQKLRFYADHHTRRIVHNDTPLTRLSDLIGLIQGVVMTPENVHLVKGPPAIRRQFLDIQLSQANPTYLHQLARYTKAMRQRNQLLKQAMTTSLESWEYQMAQAAAYVVMQRRAGVEILNRQAQVFYAQLTEQQEGLELKYRSSTDACATAPEIQNFLLEQFQRDRAREISLGYTLQGPHKDDLWMAIEGCDLRHYASEGQQRSCAYALQIGAWQFLKQSTQESPLILIDDIGVSLDRNRQNRLLDYLSPLGQLFLTTTDPALASALRGSKKLFTLPV